MQFIKGTSNASIWRGLDYYREGKVLSCKKVSESRFEGSVQGNAKDPYEVTINLEHPKKSKCTCPRAKDNNVIICKHKVALYFAANPEAEHEFLQDIEVEARAFRSELEKWRADRRREVYEYVDSLSEPEVRSELVAALIERQNDDRRFWGQSDPAN